jgi:conserved oligomeric Golgi complex subunit 7
VSERYRNKYWCLCSCILLYSNPFAFVRVNQIIPFSVTMAVASGKVSVISKEKSAVEQPQSSEEAAQVEQILTAILESPNFTVAEYLNTALGVGIPNDEDESVSNKDTINEHQTRRMTELALQLQLQTQFCHEEIGRVGTELQAIVPRCAADSNRIKIGLEGLQVDCTNLLNDCTSGSAGNQDNMAAQSMETLSTLHALQLNLTRTKEILLAAATWDTTIEALTNHMAQQNLNEAVQCLTSLEQSEGALRGMPEPEIRIQTLDRIRQQVATLLQPTLQHALAVLHSSATHARSTSSAVGGATSTAPLQQCVHLYDQLNQLDTLVAEYVKQRPSSIHKLWFEYTPPVPQTNGLDPETCTSSLNEPHTLLSWLPTFYDNVLQFVTEERRQCMTIFGSKRVPEITILVVRECFRPLLPSFVSRLHTVCTATRDIDAISLSQPLQLPIISALYESTLHFLSLMYETIVGGWMDMAESEQDATTTLAPALFNDLMHVFEYIASPFTDYQKNLAAIESKFLAKEVQFMTKEIQKATKGIASASASLDALQSATDRLQELSRSGIFSIAETAVARLELLNGGYSAAAVATVIDKVLANYGSELSVAIHKLSAAMISDDQLLVENFDEQHVLCALEVLKVASFFHRNLKSLESKSRERLAVLSDRVRTYIKKDKYLRDALSGGAGKSSFQLSDSMSIVEIDSLLTKTVCVGNGDLEASYAVLVQFAVPVDKANVPLFPEANGATGRLIHSCHTFVFDICISVPRLYLRGVSSLATWKESGASADASASYGTLPQEYITHVGEHMLALVQALEPFATDQENLKLAKEVMDGSRRVAQQPWLDFVVASGCEGSENVTRMLMDGSALLDYVLDDTLMHGDDHNELEEHDDEDAKAITTFCNAWLDVVGSAVAGRLLERIMRIPLLTNKGCEHLHADLGYLMNVFSALGIAGHPHPLLGHLATLATLEESVLRERYDGMTQQDSNDTNDAALAIVRLIEQRFLAMRSFR